MNYDLVRPCPHRPFRSDVPAYLHRERCGEIAEGVIRGAQFPCLVDGES